MPYRFLRKVIFNYTLLSKNEPPRDCVRFLSFLIFVLFVFCPRGVWCFVAFYLSNHFAEAYSYCCSQYMIRVLNMSVMFTKYGIFSDCTIDN